MSRSALSISGVGFTGVIPEAVSELTALQRLDLSRNRLVGTVPVGVLSIPSLRFLNLSHNLLSGDLTQLHAQSTVNPRLRYAQTAGQAHYHGFRTGHRSS